MKEERGETGADGEAKQGQKEVKKEAEEEWEGGKERDVR